jgi:flagellar L-ring protein precursor FlgH
MSRGLLILAFAFGVASAQEKENPGSLFSPGSQNPLFDRTARKVGDILTVIVTEEAVADFAAKTSAAKAEGASFSPNFVVDFFKRIFRPFGVSSSSSSQAEGRTSQNGKLTARLSVLVVDVTPSGNLVIEGTRAIGSNRQTQTFRLRGTVRPFDVRPDNTVPSALVANAEIAVGGAGLIHERQRKGLITTLLDWLF